MSTTNDTSGIKWSNIKWLAFKTTVYMIPTNLVVEWFSIRYQAAEKFSLVKSALMPGNSASKSFWGNLPLKNEHSFLQWDISQQTYYNCHIKNQPTTQMQFKQVTFQQDVNLYLTMVLNLVLQTHVAWLGKRRLKFNLSKTTFTILFSPLHICQKYCPYKMLLKKELLPSENGTRQTHQDTTNIQIQDH